MNTPETPRQDPPLRPSAAVTLSATGLGAGLLPGAPGTWGSLLAVLAAWPIAAQWGWMGLFVASALAFAIGIPVSTAYTRRTGQTDPGEVVIDEIAGQWLTLVPAVLIGGPDWVLFVAGFALFRLFDIWKPWPIRTIERNTRGGFGIMIDDMAAALPAGLFLYGFAQLMGH